MRYFGGKFRIGKLIAEYINSYANVFWNLKQKQILEIKIINKLKELKNSMNFQKKYKRDFYDI